MYISKMKKRQYRSNQGRNPKKEIVGTRIVTHSFICVIIIIIFSYLYF